jgi:outer membrane protein assembly factor BamA
MPTRSLTCLLALVLVSCGGEASVVPAPLEAPSPATRRAPPIDPCPVPGEKSATLAEIEHVHIARICFRGNERETAKDLREAILSRVAAPLELEVVEADIQRLFARETFEDVEARASLGEGGVTLVYVVKERVLAFPPPKK